GRDRRAERDVEAVGDVELELIVAVIGAHVPEPPAELAAHARGQRIVRHLWLDKRQESIRIDRRPVAVFERATEETAMRALAPAGAAKSIKEDVSGGVHRHLGVEEAHDVL